MLDEIRRLALFASGVAELTRHRAEQIARTVIGEDGEARVSEMVKHLVDASKKNREELTKVIRSEMRTQVENLGLATRADLERLESRVIRLEGGRGRKKSTAKRSATGAASRDRVAKKPSRRTSAARKSSAQPTSSGRSAARARAPKSTRKRTTARTSAPEEKRA